MDSLLAAPGGWWGVLLVALVLLYRVSRAIPWRRRQRSPGTAIRCESGAATTLDFILVFPTFVMILLIVVQLALLINATIFVRYSAFLAARSAIVWMESDVELARKHAEQAAEIGLIPVSPSHLPGGNPPLPIPSPSVTLLLLHAPNYGSIQEDGLFGRVVRRTLRLTSKRNHSRQMTDVTLTPEHPGAGEPLTATVRYRFYLSIPYADGFFAALPGGSYFPAWPTMEITDSVTLINQGKVVTKEIEQ